MKKVGITTDSHSGILEAEAKRLGIHIIPMPFFYGEECFLENLTITREEFFRRLKSGEDARTSQPTPEQVTGIWDEALQEYETIVHIPISSGLSGSCMTAQALALEEPYEGKVFVVDNGRVATLLHRSILDAVELIEDGYDAPQIKKILEDSRSEMIIYIGVDTLECLKRGGRVKSSTAAIGNLLNIKPVLKFDVGTLDMYQKCRGTARMKKTMLDAIKREIEERFSKDYSDDEIYIVAASSSEEERTNEWLQEIQNAFPGKEIICDDLSLGVSCHIGPGGLGIGISCKPKRG